MSASFTTSMAAPTASSRPEEETDNGVVRVDPSWFESPVHRLGGISGGTAPFFRLVLTDTGMQQLGDDRTNCSQTYFIGKDLSHATDEVDFYNTVAQLSKSKDSPHHINSESEGVGKLIPFMFDYLGTLETTEATTEEEADTTNEPKKLSLLVMKNLRDGGYDTYRMLDLKIGRDTAQAGWKGKSWFRAHKQRVLDRFTNSSLENYRLEGFDGCSQVVESMDPLMDLKFVGKHDHNGDESVTPSKARKKAQRLMFQHMNGAEIFMHFLESPSFQLSSSNGVGLETNITTSSASIDDECFTPMEKCEIILEEIAIKLIRLAQTCHSVRIPQKWIGSSVAIAYDAGDTKLNTDEQKQTGACAEEIISKVQVNVFDWGRSELLLAEDFHQMSAKKQLDRERFWRSYQHGIDALAYHAICTYYHHFTNTLGWRTVTIKVMDFDSLTNHDYMGQIKFDLPDPTNEAQVRYLSEAREYQLVRKNQKSNIFCCSCYLMLCRPHKCIRKEGKAPYGSITLQIQWNPLPTPSNVKGFWRVTIIKASNLVAFDYQTQSSDPFCLVQAVGLKEKRSNNARMSFISKSNNPTRKFVQMTTVKTQNLNPEWNESFDIPVMVDDKFDRLLDLEGLPSVVREKSIFSTSFSSLLRNHDNMFDCREHYDISTWSSLIKKDLHERMKIPTTNSGLSLQVENSADTQEDKTHRTI